MDAYKVGKAIAYLRKKVGYTQKELADRIGVSDKAVSKWERGVGFPDTSIIGKIAILLDSDTDSLLAGDIIHHSEGWTGLLILRDNPYGIGINTIIYDKPVINFLLSYFLLVGIKKIRIVCKEANRKYLKETIATGEKYGLELTYWDHVYEEEYVKEKSNVMVVSDSSIIYGVELSRFFQKAMLDKSRITVLSLPKKTTDSLTRIYYDSDKKVVNSEDGEKIRTQYAYYQMPILFCPAKDICRIGIGNDNTIPYTKVDGDIYTVVLDRGFIEISLSTWEDVIDASLFVKIVQKSCGMQLYCIEEIAWRRGMITRDELIKLGEESKDTPYGKYILEIAEKRIEKK